MKNRKRLLTLALLCMAVAFSVLGLTACGNKGDNRDPQIVAVYNAYVANANEKGSTPLSYEEWLKSIKGDKGDKGDPGKSTYEIWLDNGFTGTEQDFLNWLKNQSNNANPLGLGFALTDEDTYSVSVGLATERSVIVIPATYNNKPVTKIANKAFNECKNLKKITIPDSVTSIGEYAFSGCTSLTGVTIGSGVTSIGYEAFYNCSSLTSVTIPDSVTSIGKYAFEKCTSLTSVTIPDSVTSIGNGAFSGCSSLTSVTIPDSVTSIGSSSFYNCTSLTSVTIPDGVTRIGNSAISGCSSLTSITIPDGVTSIGNSAFSYCSSLTSVTIPDSVTSIGEYAFNSCSSLNAVYITDIAAWCNIKFNNYASNPLVYAHNLYLNGELVTNLVIPDGVTSIGERAFVGCSSLTSITIPDSVTSIGEQAFDKCNSLNAVYIPDISAWCNIKFNDNPLSYAQNLYLNGELVTNLVIPDSVTRIGNSAFYNCSSLTSITIGNSATSIGNSAFAGCHRLVEVINKSNLNITKGSQEYGSVGAYALNVKTEGESDIVNKNDYLFYTYDNINYLLGYVGNDTNLNLPKDYNGESYRIYKYAFYGCASLTSVTIPDSVTSIGEYAFSYCTSLTGVTIGNGVTSIDSSAFYNCSSLTGVTIPDSVTSIGYGAFFNCNNTQTVFYKGGKEQWDKIGYAGGININKLYFYSEAAPTDSGNYWHYAKDGVTPVIW